MNIAAVLAQAARRFPDAPATTWRGTTRTYHDLDARSTGIAAALARSGIGHGDRVGVLMANRPELLESMFAAFRLGCGLVPLNARFNPDEVAYHVGDAGMVAVLTDPDHADVARKGAGDAAVLVAEDDLEAAAIAGSDQPILADVDRDDLAWLFYTSGTTGRPKGAMLPHAVLDFATASWLADLTPMDEHDVVLHAAPLSHGAGFHALAATARAAHQVILDEPSFDPASVMATLQTHGVTNTWMVPTQIVLLVDALDGVPPELPALERIVYGGAPFPPSELARALEALGPVLVQLYGQGETPMTATVLRPEDHTTDRLASAGAPRPGVDLRIHLDDGTEAPPGEVGEVVVRGPSVMLGYWQRPDETAETLRGGWLHTGDLGRLDERGYLYLLDRAKDMIISGGSNVYAVEVEQVLLDHPDIADAAVVGVPDRVWGERVVAVVVAREGSVDLDRLDGYCRDQLSGYKRPRAFHQIEALPRNAYGKVRKADVRQLVAELPADG